MEHNEQVKTYSAPAFRHRFMKEEAQLDQMLKQDFGKFFITRVEDMLKMIRLPVPPNRVGTHIIIFLTEGEANISIGNQTFKCFKNECIIVPTGQIVSFEYPDTNLGFICNVHEDFLLGKATSPDFLRAYEFFSVWGNPRIDLGEKSGHFVQQLFQRMLDEYELNGLKNSTLLQANFMAIVAELDQHYQSLEKGTNQTYTLITHRFKELLSLKIRQRHKVADYAGMLNVSPNHLNKVIKASTGKSAISWINELLVMEAKVLLYQTNLSINEVAAELGVMDSSYFSRFFKKHVGHSPMQFRKLIESS